MTLPAADLLAPVVAPRAADFRALDRLAVDVADARRRVAALGHADILAQGVRDPLPGAVVTPLREVVPDGALGQQVVREQFPLATGAGLVQEGVEHLPHVGLAWSPARLGGRDQGLDDLPLLVGQVGLVGLSHRGAGGYPRGWTPVPAGILGLETTSRIASNRSGGTSGAGTPSGSADDPTS